jgi:signal transduction histidine kinase
MEIDVRTLFSLFSVGNFFTVLFLSGYIILNKTAIPFINIFLAAKVMQILLWVLFALRGMVPDLLSISVANTLLWFAFTYEIYAIVFAEQDYCNFHFFKYQMLPVAMSIVFLAFVSQQESFRVIVASFLLSFLFLGAGSYLCIKRLKNKMQHLASYFFFGGSILIAYRALWVLFSNEAILLYTSNVIQIITYSFLFLVSSSWTIMLLLILKEQDEVQIKNDNLKLNELNKSKDKFFSIIAHDLKGSVGGVHQIGELLWIMQKELSITTKEKLTEELYFSIKRTSDLLDNLLNWARSNSGRIKYSPETIHIDKIVKENIQILAPLASLKHISITSLEVNKIVAFADYEMISTVIRNLLSNAIKFTPKGGKIEIVTKANDKLCTIGIFDSGVGIRQKDLEAILKLDSSVSTPGTEEEKGSGLGLKLCKEFVEKNNGRIYIESEVNKGTKVWVELPIIKT